MPFYFAYGSNMSPVQMAERCPGSRAVGTGVLPEWRFHITTRGSASIVPLEDGCVHGVLWRCGPANFHRLDGFEGVHWGNYRRRLVLVDAGGDRVSAITYVNMRRHPGRARTNYMLTAVIPGAEAFGLPEGYLEELRGWLPDRPVGNVSSRYRGRRRQRRSGRAGAG